MNLGQTLIVVLAVVLFGTLIVSIYNSMTNQMMMATQTTYQQQAMLVAEACFQKLEAEYIIAPQPSRDFAQLNARFPDSFSTNNAPYILYGTSVPDATIIVGDAGFTPYISTRYWTQLQNGGPATSSNYIRMTCSVRISPSSDPNDDYWVGGPDVEEFNSVKSNIYTP